MKRLGAALAVVAGAAALVAAAAAPAAAQQGATVVPHRPPPPEIQAAIDDCEALASQPAGTSRADPDALQKWSECLELLEGSSWGDAHLETEWMGTVARTDYAPLSAYTVHWDAGAWDHITRKLQGIAMTVSWWMGTGLLSLSVWAFDWVLNSRATDLITGVAEELRDAIMDSGLLGGLLGPAAVLASMTAAAIAVIRRRAAEGIGHLVWLLLVIIVGVMLVSESDAVYAGARKFRTDLTELAVDPAQAAAAANPTGGIDAGLITQPLLQAVVHEPWEQINWGGTVPAGQCQDLMAEVLARRPTAVDDWPRQHMENCPDGAAENAHNPSRIRVMAAMMIALAQVFMALVIGMLALMALASEILLALAFALLPAAVVLAAFPGTGREVAAAWLRMLIRGLLGLVIGLFGLRVFNIVFTAVVEHLATEQVPLLSRFAIFAALSFLFWRYRKKLPQLGRTVAGKFGGKLVGAGQSGGGGGGGAAAAGLLGGLGLAAAAGSAGGQAAGLAGVARSARAAAQKVTTPVTRTAAGLAGAFSPDSRTAKVLGSTKAAGGAGMAMGATLASAQGLGTRHAAKSAARAAGRPQPTAPPRQPDPATPPPPPNDAGNPPPEPDSTPPPPPPNDAGNPPPEPDSTPPPPPPNDAGNPPPEPDSTPPPPPPNDAGNPPPEPDSTPPPPPPSFGEPPPPPPPSDRHRQSLDDVLRRGQSQDDVG